MTIKKRFDNAGHTSSIPPVSAKLKTSSLFSAARTALIDRCRAIQGGSGSTVPSGNSKLQEELSNRFTSWREVTKALHVR